MRQQSPNKVAQPHHGSGQSEKVPQEKEYRIYAKYEGEDLRRRLVPEILEEFPDRGLRLYGSRLPRCDQALAKAVEALKLKPLQLGSAFNTNDRQYKIEKSFGSRTYRIMDVSTKIRYFLKLEAIGLPRGAPLLKRDILLMNNAYETSLTHRRHFLSIFDRGSFPDQYNFVIVQLCDCNLSDLRTERLNGADFSRSTALHIASQTLQGIHDVQLHHYYHRDVRAGNFTVGLNEKHNIIYIINFSLSYEYVARNARIEQGKKQGGSETPRITPKLPWISCRFQSRAFHLGQEIRRLDDVESWVYLIIDMFDQKMLPWKRAKSERVGYEQKERLFMGDYGEQLGDLKPYIDIMTRYLENCRSRSSSIVDFPFFGNILEQMAQDWKITGKEPLDWAPDPRGYRNIPRAEAEKAKKTKEKSSSKKKAKKTQPTQQQQPVAVEIPQSPTTPAPAAVPEEEEFNFLPIILPEPITKETAKTEVPAPAAEPPKPDQPKKVQSPIDGSGKTFAEKEKNEAAATDKKDINAIRKDSTKANRRASRAATPAPVVTAPSAAAKKSLDESETKKKEKEKEEESDTKKGGNQESKYESVESSS